MEESDDTHDQFNPGRRNTTRLREAAQQEGIAPVELARKLVTEHLPSAHDENAASIALLQFCLEEDATDDPDEIRQA